MLEEEILRSDDPRGMSGSMRLDDFGGEAARTRQLTDRLLNGLSICLAATLCLLFGELAFGYSRSRWNPLLQASTAILLVVVLRILRRQPRYEVVVRLGWLMLGVMCFGTALIGSIDHEPFTTSSLIIALAMTAATLLPWGVSGQLGAVMPMAVAYLFILWRVDLATAWGPRLPFGVVVVLGASVYIAYSLERERNAVGLERRRRAAENSQLLEELKRANEIRSEFVSTMSHELRTPLNVILGYNELLTDGTMGAPTDAQRDALERVRANALELLELVNATLDLHRLEAGSVSIHAQTFEPSELAAELDAQLQLLLADGVDLRWQLQPDLPPVCSDVAKLKVILKNLTTNAIKFTREGSVTVRFALSAGQLVIEVADTGIGMTPEALKVVFEPFRQADATIQRDFGGAGLGLHIVQRLVTMLGGAIEVESEPDRGTTMRVRLPQLRPVDSPPSETSVGAG